MNIGPGFKVVEDPKAPKGRRIVKEGEAKKETAAASKAAPAKKADS